MFHAPNEHRITEGIYGTTAERGNNGGFVLPSPIGKGHRQLVCIASDGMGWEHVSVHARIGKSMQTPMWDEMCFIKRLFWDAEDVVIQYHPKESEYVNNAPAVLHLWRKVDFEMPTPPSWMVGFKDDSAPQAEKK